MCGIAGIVDLSGAPVDTQTVHRMTRVLAHRGPDHEGFHFEPGVGLGHRRLSILDLSPSGNQPMSNEDGSVWITFNGEIYNFQRLRPLLEAKGHRFRSASDTEVVLHGYEEWGEAVWERLEGFFALAVWDRAARRLVLARDPFGIKPLFYAVGSDHGRVVFGSEIKALLASGEVERTVNLQALSHFLTYSYTPGPDSIIEGVRQVPPGEIVTFTSAGKRPSRYWQLQLRENLEAMSESALGERVRDECRLAVKESLVSDVPVGLLLSGGIDSNIVLSELMAIGYPDIQSITVGFRQDSFDEAAVAERRLSGLGLRGRVTFVEDHKVDEIFDEMIYHLDCLSANVANLGEYYIFQAAAKHFKVALAGMGNDELFAGYPTYLADRVRPYYRWLPRPIRGLLGALVRRLPPSGKKYGLDFVARKFTEGAEYDALKSHYWWRTFFTPEDKQRLFRPEAAGGIELDAYPMYDRFYQALPDASVENRILYADLQMFCIENANILLDNLSMAFSVEVRPPFLSKRFVEFAFSVPYRLKLKRTTTKYALRHAYRRILPDDVLRRRKSGLVSPVSQLLRGPLRGLTEATFAAASKHPYLDPAYCQRLLQEHLTGRRDHGLMLYSLLTYFRWYDRFIESPNRSEAVA